MALNAVAWSQLDIVEHTNYEPEDRLLILRAGYLNSRNPSNSAKAVRLTDVAGIKINIEHYAYQFTMAGQSALKTTIKLSQLFMLCVATVNYPCRLRLYSNIADQDTDYARYPATVKPSVNNVIDLRFKDDLLSINLPFLNVGSLESDKRVPLTINLESGIESIDYSVNVILSAIALDK